MSLLKTISMIDAKVAEWATPKHAHPAPPATHASLPIAHTSSVHLGHVSPQDLEAAIAALKNMKQLSAWVNHTSGEFRGYAAGGVKAYDREAVLS